MTAINNFRGTIVREGRVIYSEEIEPNLSFCIIQMYRPFSDKEGTPHSSGIYIEACITTGEVYNWSNGVKSLEPAEEWEKKIKKEDFRSLHDSKTKDGFKMCEVVSREYFDKEDQTYNRRITWIVEVPKEALIKFFN